jgi:hypothetical protein
MNIKEGILSRANLKTAAQFIVLLSIISILPFFIHLQWLTGPIVNAILVIILFVVGKREALLACFIPSVTALAGGLLPFVLFPMVPFIILGNIIYILAIDYFLQNSKPGKNGYWLGVGIGSFAKFIFIFSAGQIIGRLFLTGKLTVIVAQMVSWPQFATAFLGGMIAWVVIKKLKRI